MKSKNIKVVYTNRYSQGAVPKIQMEGKWLEQLGFTIGTPLILEYEQQALKAELKHRKAELEKLEDTLSMVAESLSEYSSSSHR